MSLVNVFDSEFRFYVTPFLPSGVYADEIEFTDYVVTEGNIDITQRVDGSRFSFGTYVFNSFTIVLNNTDGFFSDVGSPNSIFGFKRSDSKIRITYNENINLPICGNAIAGSSVLGQEVDIFEGFLEDSSTTQNIDDQLITFKVLSQDSIFRQVQVPYASISNGDNVSSVIETCLNQTKITNVLDVSASNINVSIDSAIDDKSPLENLTVKEALDRLLLASNSVLFIKDGSVIVKDRSATAVTQKKFFGQASDNGLENIINITNYSTGLNSVFNFIKWSNTSLVGQDSTSIDIFGIREASVVNTIITNSTKRQNILNNIRDQFKDAKLELELEAPLTEEFTGINLFDRVNIDYPTVTYTPIGEEEARYEIGSYNEAVYPFSIFNLTIDDSINWKVIGKTINVNNATLKLILKEV